MLSESRMLSECRMLIECVVRSFPQTTKINLLSQRSSQDYFANCQYDVN